MKRLFSRLFDRTFLRYFLVGIVNTIVGSSISFACYNLLHLTYWVSTAANYLFSSILSYFLNSRFTFRDREKSPRTAIRFAIHIVCCYLIAYGAAKPLTHRLLTDAGQTIQDNGAMLVGMGLFVILNYLGQRFFTFADKSSAEKNR